MKAHLIPSSQGVEKIISECLTSGEYDDFKFSSAYARKSAVTLLQPALKSFLSNNGRLQCVIGVNQGVTSYQAIKSLLEISSNADVYVRCAVKGRATFHHKVYMFNSSFNNSSIQKCIVGSSNFTQGGLKTNEECSVLLDVDKSDKDFHNSIKGYWKAIRDNNDRFSTIKVTDSILDQLLECGALVDETKRVKKVLRVSQKSLTGELLANEIGKIIDTESTPINNNFVMTLSNFDMSDKSADPVILIPLIARNKDNKFWFYPEFFVSERKYDDIYLNAIIYIDGVKYLEQIRLYWYTVKHEFRLKSKKIKRNGEEGDIMLVKRDGRDMSINLIRKGSTQYQRLYKHLTGTTKTPKRWGYF